MFWKKKKEKKGPKYVKFCPRCRSLNIKIDSRGPLVALGLPEIYVCLDCGFRNYFFPEIDMNKLKELKESGKKL